MATVAGYVRVSTEEQRQEESHIRQRERLEQWAANADHDLTIFEDIAVSGQSDSRPEYEAMMDRVRAGEFEMVVVRELSRFGRSLQRVLRDIEVLDEHGTEFKTLDGQAQLDTSTAQGKLLFQIIGAFNEFWANLARERAQEEIERRRAEGEPIGRPPKADAEAREEAQEWREKGLSYGEIQTLLREVHDVEVDRSTVYRYCQRAE